MIRLGIIGAGAHATNAILPSLHRAGVELAAVCDLDLERAREVARRFGAATTYDDHRRMLRHERLDAVAAIGPPAMHVEVGLDVIAAGVDLFVEKPPGATLEQARRLQAAAHEGGRQVMVGFTKRFARVYRRAREVAGSQEFGPARLLRYNLSHWRFSPLRDHLLLNGVHAFDLARFLLGDVRAGTVAKRPVGKDHVVALLLEHVDGGFSQLSLSALEPRFQESFELSGDSCLLQARTLGELRYIRAAPDKAQTIDTETDESMAGLWQAETSLPHPHHQSLYVQGYVPELTAFASALASGAHVSPNIDDGVEAMRMLEAVLKAPAGLSPLALPA